MSKTISQIDFLIPNCKTVSEMNDRSHWAARNKRKREQQELVAAYMHNALGGRKVELPCVVMLTRIGPRKLDAGDNLSAAFKGIRDAVARQLGVDDGSDQVEFRYDQMPIGSRDYSVKVSIHSLRNGDCQPGSSSRRAFNNLEDTFPDEWREREW